MMIPLLLRQPIQHRPFLLRLRLLFFGRRHFSGEQIFEHQGPVEAVLFEELLHVEISLLCSIIVAVETIVLQNFHHLLIRGSCKNRRIHQACDAECDGNNLLHDSSWIRRDAWSAAART